MDYQHYQRLLSIVQEQYDLCKSKQFGDEDTLKKLDGFIMQRQEIIAKIDSLQQQPDFVYNPKTKPVLQKIIEVDQACREILETQKKTTASHIRKVVSGKKTVKAYEPTQIQADGYFIDHKK